MVQKDEENQERDYLLTGNPELIKPLTTHLLATLERFEELDQKLDFILDLIHQLKNRNQRSEVAHYPKITLYFEQKKEDIKPEFPSPVHGQISFRWMAYTLDKIRNDEKALKQMAEKIKAKFVKPLFYFDKGKKVGMYNHPAHGFNWVWSEFKDEATARKVFEQVLDLQSKTPDWERLNISSSVDPAKAYSDNPNKVLILGESVREPRKRPTGRVFFKHAFITLPPKKKPIYLVDTTGKKDALVYL